jgi:hypothetical protein
MGDTHPNSPILVDVFQLGVPNLLAGPAWKKYRPAAQSFSAYRLFDFDGTGPKYWEWVGPKTGILLYGETEPVSADGTVLFGTRTFGKEWNHGYEPLATLDADRSGALEGKELDKVWMWLDANSDAKVDKGEVKSSSSYVRALRVVPETDPLGNAWSEKGAVLLNGQDANSWDWWSMPIDPELTETSLPKPYSEMGVMALGAGSIYTPDLLVYAWKTSTGDIGGYLRFIKDPETGSLYVLSALPGRKHGVYSQVEKNGGQWQWEFRGPKGTFDTAVATVDDHIIEATNVYWDPTYPGAKEPRDYSWSAVRVATDGERIHDDFLLLAGVDEPQFLVGVKQVGPPSGEFRIDVMIGSKKPKAVRAE